MKTIGVKILSVTKTNDEGSWPDFMRGLNGLLAEFENKQRAERTVNGMKQAVEQSRWCWRPHIGYKRERDHTGKPVLVPSEDAPFIQEAFLLAETGLYKQADIVKELKRKGFKKLNEKRLNNVLRNSIYAGIIKVNWLPEPIDGIHSPLISKATFAKVQLILNGKRPRITPHNRNHPDFPLRNFMRCAKCGNKLTGSWSRGRKGIKYAYYSCYNKRMLSERQEARNRKQIL